MTALIVLATKIHGVFRSAITRWSTKIEVLFYINSEPDRLLVILSHFHNACVIICLRPSYSRNSKHCMSFFNLNSSCIFVCHFINCFNCCIYEWHSWLGNLKKLKLGNRDAAYKVPLWNRDQPFNLKRRGAMVLR